MTRRNKLAAASMLAGALLLVAREATAGATWAWHRPCAAAAGELVCDVWFNTRAPAGDIEARVDAAPVDAEIVSYQSAEPPFANAVLLHVPGLSRSELRALRTGVGGLLRAFEPSRQQVGLFASAADGLEYLGFVGEPPAALVERLRGWRPPKAARDPLGDLVAVMRILGGNRAERRAVYWLTTAVALSDGQIERIRAAASEQRLRLATINLLRSELDINAAAPLRELGARVAGFYSQIGKGELATDLAEHASFSGNGATIALRGVELCGERALSFSATANGMPVTHEETLALAPCAAGGAQPVAGGGAAPASAPLAGAEERRQSPPGTSRNAQATARSDTTPARRQALPAIARGERRPAEGAAPEPRPSSGAGTGAPGDASGPGDGSPQAQDPQSGSETEPGSIAPRQSAPPADAPRADAEASPLGAETEPGSIAPRQSALPTDAPRADAEASQLGAETEPESVAPRQSALPTDAPRADAEASQPASGPDAGASAEAGGASGPSAPAAQEGGEASQAGSRPSTSVVAAALGLGALLLGLLALLARNRRGEASAARAGRSHGALVIEQAGQLRRHALTRLTTKLGRSRDNDIVLTDDSVSAFHALLKVERDGRVSLVDLHSTNRSFVNEVEVTQHTLSPGDTIRLGAFSFVFAAE